MIGHFTQVIWAETSRVGCGFTVYSLDGAANQLFYSCNYAPGGNMVDSQIYQLGAPASQCPSGYKASSDYPSLCAAPN